MTRLMNIIETLTASSERVQHKAIGYVCLQVQRTSRKTISTTMGSVTMTYADLEEAIPSNFFQECPRHTSSEPEWFVPGYPSFSVHLNNAVGSIAVVYCGVQREVLNNSRKKNGSLQA